MIKSFLKYLWFLLVFLNVWGFSEQAVLTYSPIQNRSTEPIKQYQIVITYNFLNKNEIKELAQSLFPTMKININNEKKKIMVSDIWKNIRSFRELIRNLDKNKPTLEFSINLIEINHNELQEIGLDWQKAKDSIGVAQVRNVSAFMNKISFLFKNGKAQILANPVIISLENEEAVIKVGDRVPYAIPVEHSNNSTGWQLQYLDAGIELRIKGKVVSGDIIETHIFTTINNIKQWKATSSGEYPVLSSREVDVLCQIKNEGTIVLGGLTNSNTRENISKLPFLGDIPFIGEIFKTITEEEEKSEIVFLLSPKIKSL